MLTYWEHWRIQGGGSGGSRPPIRHDACLILELLHRQDRISLLKWLIISMKRTLNFAINYIPGILKKIILGYPIGDWRSQIKKHVVVSGRSNLPQKKSNSPFSTKVWTPHQEKIPRSPPPVIYHKLLLISRPANKPRPLPPPTPFLDNPPGNKKNTSDYKPPGCESPSNFYTVCVLK